MKTKHIYVVYSLKEDATINFSNHKKAEDWIKKRFNHEIFPKSGKDDLYIVKRIVF